MNTQLCDALKQEDTVLFIGSGISCWSNLPSWFGLLKQLAEFLDSSDRDGNLVRKEIGRDLLQAASYGFDQLTIHEIGTFIRQACKAGEVVPHEIHRKIVSLGPRCFITTNYDHLLEDSLRKWQPNRSYNTITNRQPFEEADIIQARALDFVFKPHGDVSDVASVILTREQYRKMFEGGELKHTLESLKTLLVTRRVVYLGFGLRDPDFLMIRDVVANTWQGGTRDHYAIVADVESGEINYWRKNYGIHLVSYETTALPDGRRDHSALLQLLDALRDTTPPDAEIAVPDDSTSKLILPLLRYANGLMRFDAVSPEFPLRVHNERSPHVTSAHDTYFDRWEHKEVDKFFEEGPPRAILIGLPGAGKTYSLKKACSRLAEQVYKAFLADPPMSDKTIIPVFVDMKSYAGDIITSLDACFPSGLSFRHLASRFQMKVFLDSFNEIPRQQWESGAHEIDLGDFFRDFPQVNVVFGSRTKDGLEKLGLPVYFLDEIDRTFVQEELRRLNTELTGRFESELLSLLQKPFYFHLLNSGHVQFNAEPHPRDVYRLFFKNLSTVFLERFGENLDLEAALAGAAYEAISRGEEAQPIYAFLRALKKELQSAGISAPTADDVANWLVSKSVLIPYSGGRVAFFHQSVTEYLAARDLALRYLASPEILKEKLSLTRWDQAIFLTLSFLTPPAEEEFIQSLMDIDFALALNAAKYVEINRELIVAKLLAEIPNRIRSEFSFSHAIAWALEYQLPLTDANETQLVAIMNLGDIIGAGAATRLLELKGVSVKDSLLQSLLERRSDFKYCTGVGRALKAYIRQSDLESLAMMADSIEGEMDDDQENPATLGFIDGIAEAIGRIPLAFIQAEFLYSRSHSVAKICRTRIVLDLLSKQASQTSLQLAVDILMMGFDEAAFSIYLIAEYAQDTDLLSWDFVTETHVERLINLVNGNKPDMWGLEALRCLCLARNDLSDIVKARSVDFVGLRKAVFRYAIAVEGASTVFSALQNLLDLSSEERAQESTSILNRLDLDWKGHENLLIRLLELRDLELASDVIETVATNFGNFQIGLLSIGAIDWWLDWLSELSDSNAAIWLQYRLSCLFAARLQPEMQESFLAEFNRKGSKYRRLLSKSILAARTDITTDDFSEDALVFLIEDLAVPQSPSICDLLLGSTATETFVTERLLSRLLDTQEPLKSNLLAVLQQAGARHRRRYAPS